MKQSQVINRFIEKMSGMSDMTEYSDKMWLREMIKHHAQAVEMSKMAIKKADHEELKDLAKNIIETQSAEIKLMKKWLMDW